MAAEIYKSGFKPDFIVGIWRGGTPVGIAIQEYFEFVGITTDHISVRTSAYYGINQRSKTIRVHGLHYIIEEANAGLVCSAGDAMALSDNVLKLAELPPEIRDQMGENGRSYAETHFGREHLFDRLEEWINEAVLDRD